MSMMVREMITGITGFVADGETNGSYYNGTAGQLPGADNMAAAVLAYLSPDLNDTRVKQGLFGNLDSRGFAGWEIGVNNVGQAYASYGDGTNVVTITAPGEVEPYRWALIAMTLDTVANRFCLFVNGQLQAEIITAIAAIVPSALAPRLGASSNSAGPGPSSELIAGAAYKGDGTPLDKDILGYWEQVSRSGQIIPRSDAFFASPTFQNVWQSTFYNDGAHPPVDSTQSDAKLIWLPAVGTMNLLQTHGVGLLKVTQSPAIWASEGDGGGGGALPTAPYAMFYGLTAGTGNGGATDYAGTIAVMTAAGTGRVPFPRLGPASIVPGTPVAGVATDFVLPDIGTYEVTFRVHTTEPGQLELELNGAQLPESLAVNMNPTAGGHPIIGNCLITTTVINSLLAVINPPGNATALTITPADGFDTHANAQSITIKKIG